MSWNYENFLEGQLNSFAEDFTFKVEDERQFLESGVDNNKCYVVIKYLASEVEFGFIKRQPISLTILGLPSDRKINEITKAVNDFVCVNNYTQKKYGDQTIKQEYMSPVVLDGFYPVGNTKRPVIYLSGTLNIMDDVADLETLTIDGEEVAPLSFSFNYVMQPNTQPDSTEYLAKSSKSSASLCLTMTIPMTNVYGTLIKKVLKVSNGTLSGNSDFVFAFSINEIPFATTQKLTSCQFATAPNNVPTIVLTFMR